MGSIDDAVNRLSQGESFLVLSHASPDGDTLGSAATLMRALIKKGKRVDFLCADKPAAKYDYLFKGISFTEESHDTIVTVDVADPQLLGKLCDSYKDKIDLAIDHHGTHIPFGKVEWVEPKASAVAEMMYELALKMGVDIDSAMADCIYTGISTDTGCFRYTNATSKSYRTAADVIDLGANAAEINRVMFDTKTRACAAVERVVMRDMEFYHNDKIALVSLPKSLVEGAGADESDLEGIPAIPRRIEGVLLGITIKEKDGGLWKASVRAFPPVDASVICGRLGGGGHMGAAGCSLTTDYNESRDMLIAQCEKYLEEVGL